MFIVWSGDIYIVPGQHLKKYKESAHVGILDVMPLRPPQTNYMTHLYVFTSTPLPCIPRYMYIKVPYVVNVGTNDVIGSKRSKMGL